MSQPKAIVIGTGFGYITHLRALREAGFEAKRGLGEAPGRNAASTRMPGPPGQRTVPMPSRQSPSVQRPRFASRGGRPTNSAILANWPSLC